jgi:hypothetical protein
VDRQDRKARAQELAHDISKSTSFETMAIKELIGILVDVIAYQMIECNPNDLVPLQGEARALRRLQMMLLRPALKKDDQ